MKVDFGPDGRLAGTRIVGSDGEVSGLKTFAGRDVLLVSLGESGRVSSPWLAPYLEGWAEALELQAEAVRRYCDLQQAFIVSLVSLWELTSRKKESPD